MLRHPTYLIVLFIGLCTLFTSAQIQPAARSLSTLAHGTSAAPTLSTMFGDGRDGDMPTSGNLDSNTGVGLGSVNASAGSAVISVLDKYAVWRINPGDYVLLYQTRGAAAGSWELNVAVSDITGNGAFQLLNPLAYTYTTSGYQHQAQIMRVPQYATCNVTGTVTPLRAWDGAVGGILAVMCQSTLTISGEINADGYGFRGGLSGNGYATDQWQGEGIQSPSDQIAHYYQTPNITPSAQGGGAADGIGGGGGGGGYGNGADGDHIGGSTWGRGGEGQGAPDLSTMFFGGGGGGGATSMNPGVGAAQGGSGGGLIYLIARSLSLSGKISTQGLPSSGVIYDDGTNRRVTAGSGGGGQVFMRVNSASLGNTGAIAMGGLQLAPPAGGSGRFGGGAGGDGRIRIEYCSDFPAGSSTPPASVQQITCIDDQVSAIAGRLVDANNNPIADATVSIEGGPSTMTAADGSYSLNSLLPGTYTLTAAKINYQFAPASRIVTVPPSATQQNFTGTSTLTSISGRVVDTNNNPIADATITVEGGPTTITAADGFYSVNGLSSGTYTVSATKTKYEFTPASRSVTVPPSASQQNFTGTSEPGTQSWTFILYLAGDNNLDNWMRAAIKSLEAMPANDRINIIVLYDGDGNHDSRRLVIQPLGKYTKDVNQWDMGELNMGNAQTLADLISWSFQYYPAQSYYLSIADHGRGTTGTAWDETSNNDYLTPSEIRTALSAVTNFGNRKIDVLHFDACLMGMIEDVYQVKEYANYMVTMENLGWSVFAYDKYIQSAISPSGRIASPRELAMHIASVYHTHAQITNYPHTIAALDLSKTGELMQALNIFSEDLRSSMSSNQKTLQDIRAATQKFDSRDYMDITQKDEYLDLYDLVQRTYLRINNSELRISAQKVMDVIDDQFVMAEYHKSAVYQNKYIDLNNSHGVSIYFPQTTGHDYGKYINGSLFTFTSDSSWDEFLQDYLGAVALPPDDTDPGRAPMLAPPANTYIPYIRY